MRAALEEAQLYVCCPPQGLPPMAMHEDTEWREAHLRGKSQDKDHSKGGDRSARRQGRRRGMLRTMLRDIRAADSAGADAEGWAQKTLT